MKFFTKTFGCQMNFADSDEMGRHLRARGFEPTLNPEEANAILVNTCTIRDMAEHKARSYVGSLRDWKMKNPAALIILTGCAAERAKDVFQKRHPHIDLIVGAKDIEKFPEEFDALLQMKGLNEEDLVSHLRPPSLAADPISSPVVQFVTIMRGCNYNCTYCIVPAVRGRELYRPVEEILNDVRVRVEEGGKEIWLLGQTVNSYRPADPGRLNFDFSDLLWEVSRVPGVERIRFMSPHPFYLSEKLIQTMAECRTVCEHVHLPVQSGSNAVLARMKRNYTRESYLRGIEMLRKKIPGIAVSTDFIVGFPGETETDFEATLSLVKEADFDSAYCFKYSPRPGTPSAQWADEVPDQEKERRVNELLALVDGNGAEKVKSLIGTTQEVLIEDDKGAGLVRGKTRTAWRVRLQDSTLKPGMTIQAKITSTHSRELHGELIKICLNSRIHNSPKNSSPSQS